MLKEFRQVRRDSRTLGVLIFVPAFMLVMFGYALNFDVKHISLAVYDEDNSEKSREFAQNFLHSEYFDYKYSLSSPKEINELMNREEVRVALVIPPKFAEKLLTGQNSSVQVIVDGANSNAAATAVGYISAIVQDYSSQILIKTLEKLGQNKFSQPIDYRPRVWYNPELRSAKFLVPGLMGFILMITAVISTALSVVREKERGTMEQIIVSPIKPIELILGKTIPYILLSLVATFVILLFSYLLFDVSVQGSYFLLFVVTFLFITGSLGQGLLISTISNTQQVAFMIAIITTMLPTFILSGFIFPVKNMPAPIQIITYIVPAKYYLIALRSIILKGVGIEAFWQQILSLIGFAMLMLGVSTLRMRKNKL